MKKVIIVEGCGFCKRCGRIFKTEVLSGNLLCCECEKKGRVRVAHDELKEYQILKQIGEVLSQDPSFLDVLNEYLEGEYTEVINRLKEKWIID